MIKAIFHRNENNKHIKIATGIIYIKDSGVWRFATKGEVDVLEIQNNMAGNQFPIEISINIPRREIGNDGDYYALLYPLSQDGGFWDGEVWEGNS